MKIQLSHDMGKNWTMNKEREIQRYDSAQERILAITNNIATISRHMDTEVINPDTDFQNPSPSIRPRCSVCPSGSDGI